MTIEKDTIKYLAHLARIKLNDKELDLLSRQLHGIVDFIDKLKELDLTAVEPTSHILPINNVFREDKSGRSLAIGDVLGNVPMQKEEFFTVPKVIEEIRL